MLKHYVFRTWASRGIRDARQMAMASVRMWLAFSSATSSRAVLVFVRIEPLRFSAGEIVGMVRSVGSNPTWGGNFQSSNFSLSH